MKDKDLEKTQPILLSEIKEGKKRSDIYDELEDELIDITEEEKEAMEQAEEALAEKNIALAESLLADEAKGKDVDDVTSDEESEKDEKEATTDDEADKKGKERKKLNKKQKILISVAGVLVLLIIIGIIVLANVKANKKKEDPKKEEEQPVIMADNFYYKEGKLYILDKDEKEIGTYECQNKDSELCYLAYNNYADTLDVPKVLDENGKTKVERVPVYNNDYIFVADNPEGTGLGNQNIILYSLSQKKEIETYTDVKAYDGDYLIIADAKNNYGLIKIGDKVNEIIKPSYENLYMLDKADNLIAKKGNGYVVINKNNKVLSKVIETTEDLKYYTNKLIVTEDLGKYTAYDYDAKIITGDYDFITARDNYLFLINENKEMFIIDSEGSKYNEEGIKLYNDNYVTSYIYDKDGKLTSTNQAFKIEVDSDELNILVYTKDFKEDKYNTINLNEGRNNKKLAYYSYFNGKLYFYDDLTKLNLLGTYTCTNKNTVSNTDGKLGSCYQALMGNSDNFNNVIPIFNKRYVFIFDTNYNLYDLVEGKNKGVYLTVNDFLPSLKEGEPFVSGSYDVIAVNNKNKSGMISIAATKVAGKYGFNYNSLTRLGDYIVANNAANKYQIIYDESTASVEYNYNIVGYINKGSYVKLFDKANSKYYVYDDKGKKVGKDSYAYVELYDDFYAGVLNDKTLKIYDYEGKIISSKDVTIVSTDYLGSKPAFKVTKNGNSFVVSILKNGSYVETTIERVSDEPTDKDDTQDKDNTNTKKEESR